ncbi:MAG TPA: hypothetical protein VLW47_00490 [Thermodesulfobacteriota bacterium]|nr:hypothetical protein [Thermodesulfobacteriota bacterium]
MERTVCPPSMRIEIEDSFLKRERIITALVTLCAVAAITVGIVWLFLRKETLLFATLGLSSCYLIGRNFWRFRIS